MLETIGVLVVFFFLFGIGLKFYGWYMDREIKQQTARFLEFDATKINNLILASPTLRCSSGGVDKGPCIDEYKLQAFKWLMSGGDGSAASTSARMSFINRIGEGTIQLFYYYPEERNVTVYDISRSAQDLENVSAQPTRVPVVVHDPIKKVNSLAIMEVMIYDYPN